VHCDISCGELIAWLVRRRLTPGQKIFGFFNHRLKADKAVIDEAKAALVAPPKPRLPQLAHYYLNSCEERFSDLLTDALGEEDVKPKEQRRTHMNVVNEVVQGALAVEDDTFLAELDEARLEAHKVALQEHEAVLEALTNARPDPAQLKLYVACCSPPSIC
jgi:hypothetical protein